MRLPFFCCAGFGSRARDVVLVVGGDALQAADRHRLVLDAHAPAGRLARAVAGAPENARKHVRLPVDHVGVGVAARRDQPDIFGNGRVRRAGPLAIHDFVEVVRRGNVGILHSLLETRPATRHFRGVASTASGGWMFLPDRPVSGAESERQFYGLDGRRTPPCFRHNCGLSTASLGSRFRCLAKRRSA